MPDATAAPLRAAFDLLPMPALILDMQAQIIAANAAWQSYVQACGPAAAGGGVGTNYLMQCQADDVSLGPDMPRAVAGIRQVLDGSRSSFTLEFPCHHRPGERIYALHVDRCDLVQPQFVLLAYEDITQCRRSQQAVEQLEGRWKRLQSALTDGWWEWDLASNRVDYSTRYKQMLGYDAEEFGETFEAFEAHVHPRDRVATYAAVCQHLQGGPPLDHVCRVRTSTGSYRWFRVHAVATCDDAGTPVRMTGTLSDIHQLYEMQRELAWQSDLLDALPWAIVATSDDCLVVAWNRSAQQLLGYRRDEALGRPWSMFLDDAPPGTPVLARHKNGSTVKLEVTPLALDAQENTPLTASLLRAWPATAAVPQPVGELPAPVPAAAAPAESG